MKKGNRKGQIASATLVANHGIKGDAHAGPWHRQVSFLSSENIKNSRNQGLDVSFGDFAENIATSGIVWETLPIGTLLRLGETAVIEITQIGKVCHQKCSIFYQAGNCIMPKAGVFGRVLKGGKIRSGDPITFLES